MLLPREVGEVTDCRLSLRSFDTLRELLRDGYLVRKGDATALLNDFGILAAAALISFPLNDTDRL